MTKAEKKILYDILSDMDDRIPCEVFDADGYEVFIKMDYNEAFQRIVDTFGEEDEDG